MSTTIGIPATMVNNKESIRSALGLNDADLCFSTIKHNHRWYSSILGSHSGCKGSKTSSKSGYLLFGIANSWGLNERSSNLGLQTSRNAVDSQVSQVITNVTGSVMHSRGHNQC